MRQIIVGSKEEYERIQANKRTVLDYDGEETSSRHLDDAAFGE